MITFIVRERHYIDRYTAYDTYRELKCDNYIRYGGIYTLYVKNFVMYSVSVDDVVEITD